MNFNPDHPALIRAYEDLTNAVLHDMLSERGDPTAAHYDDDRDHCQDTVALAARTLYQAVEGLPRDDKPIGWNTKPFEGHLEVMLTRADLDALILALPHSTRTYDEYAAMSGTEAETALRTAAAHSRDLLTRLQQERSTFDKWGDHVEPFDTDIVLP